MTAIPVSAKPKRVAGALVPVFFPLSGERGSGG